MRAVVLAVLAAITPLWGIESLVESGFTHFYNLEYDQAIEDFEKALSHNPSSPDLHNHLAQAILFRQMHLEGALESELVSGSNSFLRRPKLTPTAETEKRFLHELAVALEITQKRLQKNPDSAVDLYAQGVSYGLRANYHFLVKKAWREALRDATAARKLHNRVTEIDPSNVDARLMQGVHDYVVGSLPLLYRMLGFLVGFRGDKQKGIETLVEVARKGNRNRIDAQVLLCALYRREGQPHKALPLLEDLIAQFPRNYLLRLEQAQMYSAIGDKKMALGVIESLERLKAAGAPGYQRIPWEKIHFQKGNIQFWYRDWDEALRNMQKATRVAANLDANTGSLAWMRLGQLYDVTARRAEAIKAYEKAIACAPESEAAKESRRYLAAPYRRSK